MLTGKGSFTSWLEPSVPNGAPPTWNSSPVIFPQNRENPQDSQSAQNVDTTPSGNPQAFPSFSFLKPVQGSGYWILGLV